MLFEAIDLQLLKEGLDQHSKNNDVTDALTGWFEVRSSLNIMDLRVGIGANVRALAPLLPLDQNWTLCVRDKKEKECAIDYLTRWAPAFKQNEEEILLERQGLKLILKFLFLPSEKEISLLSLKGHDLIVMDGHLNKFTKKTLSELVKKSSEESAVFFARLVYDGRIKLSPPQPPDNPFTAAFNRHLMEDAGCGPQAGHQALELLGDQFRMHGYTLIEGNSPLHLQEKDQVLKSAVQKDLAEAQRRIAKGHDTMIDMWRGRARRHIEVGQKDLLALPPDEKAKF